MKKNAIVAVILLSMTILLQAEEKQIRLNVRSDKLLFNELTIADLRVTENNQPVPVESLYLIKGNQIIRQQGQSSLKINPARHFIFVFSIRKYDANIDRAIDYFFQHIIQPADSLALLTPEKNYRLKAEAMKRKSKGGIADDLKALIRRDTLKGSQKYLSAIEDLSDIIRGQTRGTSQIGIEQSLSRYKEIMLGLESLRQAQQNQMFKFIETGHPSRKQKILYLFYEREFKPDFDLKTLQHMKLQYQERQEVVQLIGDLFEFFRRDEGVDLKKKIPNILKSRITINSIFFRPKFIRSQDIYMKEYSEDMHSMFSKLSRISGGILENTLNPLPTFEKLADNANLYYIISYKSAAASKKIVTLKIKSSNSRLTFIYPQQVLAVQ